MILSPSLHRYVLFMLAVVWMQSHIDWHYYTAYKPAVNLTNLSGKGLS